MDLAATSGHMDSYDFIVIGSGPAGQRAAVQAAKLGRHAAIVERTRLGGGCLHTGTIPSKTLREAILYLTGYHQRAFYGQGYRLKPHVNLADLLQRVAQVIAHETGVLEAQLQRNNVDIVHGAARFTDPHTLEVVTPEGESLALRADHLCIAVGTRPAHPPNTEFDGELILDSDQLLKLSHLPHSLTVVGGGVIGIEYASMLSALDIEVTLIDGRDTLLDFVDREIMADLMFHMRENGVVFRLGEKVGQVAAANGGVTVQLGSGKRIRADAALFCSGRDGNTDSLNLGAAGLTPGKRGLLEVNANCQTAVPHIYAAGDIIGFPGLASSSMHQGRMAALHAFKGASMAFSEFLPFGIYGVPAISMVGKTEESLTQAGVPYEVGIARFSESARGQILGAHDGVLKLIFGLEDRRLLGVHILGEGATELVHIGQAVMALGGTLDYFMSTVFNYPTLAGNYKIAALDAYNKFEA